MTIPGAGGQVPPRPDQQPGQPQGVVVSPGASAVVRAREVIISGAGAGLWVYNASGKLIASIVQSAGNDPVTGAPELAGITAYIYDAGGEQLAASLSSPVSSSPALTFENMSSTGVAPPAVYGNANAGSGAFNQLILSSGDDTGAGTVSITIQDQNLGGGILILNCLTLTATGCAVHAQSFTAAGDISAQNNLFVGSGGAGQGNVTLNPKMATPVNYPTAGKTLAQTQACLDQLIGALQNRGMIN